jgi:phosphoglycerate dehydrogenase-like enzyme
MPMTLAMYDKSFAHIGSRFEALRVPDVAVWTFGKDGMFRNGDRAVPAAQMDVDYLWLSADINFDQARAQVFETVLKCRSVKVLQTFNAGLDDPVYKKIAAKGVRICNSSAQGIAIAEYTLGQVLAVLQPIALQREQQAQRVWKHTPFREVSQTHWLIVGFGPIGQELAKRVKAFGARVSVVRRTVAASAVADRVGTMADARAFAGEADVIVLACSLNAATRGFADAGFFAAAKPGAILVNVARGGLIDDAALIAALDAGQLSTAVLDVFHEEPLPVSHGLWAHPKVRLTPHTSFAGSGVRGRWDQLFLDNIRRFAAGDALINEVNPADLA